MYFNKVFTYFTIGCFKIKSTSHTSCAMYLYSFISVSTVPFIFGCIILDSFSFRNALRNQNAF